MPARFLGAGGLPAGKTCHLAWFDPDDCGTRGDRAVPYGRRRAGFSAGAGSSSMACPQMRDHYPFVARPSGELRAPHLRASIDVLDRLRRACPCVKWWRMWRGSIAYYDPNCGCRSSVILDGIGGGCVTGRSDRTLSKRLGEATPRSRNQGGSVPAANPFRASSRFLCASVRLTSV